MPDSEDREDRPAWVSECDYPNRRLSLKLADPSLVGSHWSGVRTDDFLSDPEGNFDVFVVDGDQGTGPIVKVFARLEEEGDFLNPRPDFITSSIGSMTISPYKVAGEGFELAHWMWWAPGPFLRDEPRTWADASESH